jgi:hypothetical protein
MEYLYLSLYQILRRNSFYAHGAALFIAWLDRIGMRDEPVRLAIVGPAPKADIAAASGRCNKRRERDR